MLLESEKLPKNIRKKIFVTKTRSIVARDFFLVQNCLARISLDLRKMKVSKRFANQFKKIIENFQANQGVTLLPRIELKLPFNTLTDESPFTELNEVCLIFQSIEARFRVITPYIDNELTNHQLKQERRAACAYLILNQNAFVHNLVRRVEQRSFGRIVFSRVIRCKKIFNDFDENYAPGFGIKPEHVNHYLRIRQNFT